MTSVLAAAAGALTAAPAESGSETSAAVRAELTNRIESHLINQLPSDQRRGILFAKAQEAGCDVEPGLREGAGVLAWSAFEDPRYAGVSHIVTPELWERSAPEHREMMVTIAQRALYINQPVMPCFAPGTDPELVYAISELAYGPNPIAFQQTSRWSTTATDGNTGGQGDRITLTYSFVPDGTFVPNLIGVTGNSNLFSWLNGIYGNFNNWRPIFDEVFDRWQELIGVDYVYEPNDDGVNLNGAFGQLGTRGDIRIAAITIDGNSGTLAYNNFPNDGDMVFDSADNFYNTTTNNSLRLRNIIAHENGHGLGMLHVCPIQQNKLMEPFISLNFDGPQLDDILNGQRHYGDRGEPNNSVAQAEPLGTFGTFGGVSIAQRSIDDNNDVDYYVISTTSAVSLSVTATPAAGTYLQGPQTSACNTGTNTNYNTIHNLTLTVLDSTGLGVIGTSDSTGSGSAESLTVTLPSAGVYYILVGASTTTNNIQLYDFQFLTLDPPFLGPTVAVVGTPPSQLDPGVPASFDVTIDPNEDTLVPGSAELLYSTAGTNVFTSVPLVSNGGNSYTANLPAFECADVAVQYYVSVEGQSQGVVTAPAGAPGNLFTASVGSQVDVFADNFETDQGWSVGGTVTTAAAGRWERGVPVGAGDARVSDPPSDADGSGQCFVTGNALDNSDVDGGDTILLSPTFDGSAAGATVEYFRWFDNNEDGTAQNAFTETFIIDISNNGGVSWTNLETVGPTGDEVSGGWIFRSFEIGSVIAPSNNMRVRFIAQDPAGTIVEAGVDGFRVAGAECTDPVTCPAELDGTPGLNIFDVLAYLALFDANDPAADLDGTPGLNIFDVLAYLALFDAGCPEGVVALD